MTNSKLNPSRFSLAGFLGSDKRSLSAIVARDGKSLRALNVPLTRLVAVLKRISVKARKHLGAETDVAKGIRAVDEGARGVVPCPLCGRTFEKGEVVLTRPADNSRMVITPLSLHLIEKHQFFQGHGACYRIDPTEAAHFFGLKKK